MAGTSLDGKGVAATVAILHPFSTFDDDKQYFEEPKSATYYVNTYSALIKNYEAARHPARRQGDARRFRLGRPDLEADGRLPRQDRRSRQEARQARRLAADKKALLDKAKTFYADFDYLDSYRLALAASK